MLRNVSIIAAVLALAVIAFGAFVRLTDAGLGCPDWPGCYGHLTVPQSEGEIQAASQNFPQSSLDKGKAWREMTHRYLAGTLGILILVIAILSWRNRHRGVPHRLAFVMVALVIFQALLGMWTVTLLLKPVIVTLHLLGGMALLGMLVWTALANNGRNRPGGWHHAGALQYAAMAGVVVLFTQIALGGWVSTNYAALACPDFPVCQSEWLPEMDFKHGFQFLRELGVTAAGTELPGEALTAIHWTHRVGALATFMYLLALGLYALRISGLRACASLLLIFLVTQVSLGILNVMQQLPLSLAVAHNAGAALLLSALILLNFKLRYPDSLPGKS